MPPAASFPAPAGGYYLLAALQAPGSSDCTELDSPDRPDRPEETTEFGSWPSSWETTEVGSSFRICVWDRARQLGHHLVQSSSWAAR